MCDTPQGRCRTGERALPTGQGFAAAAPHAPPPVKPAVCAGMRFTVLLGAAAAAVAALARHGSAVRSGGDALIPDTAAETLRANGFHVSDTLKFPGLHRRGPGSADYDASLEEGSSVRGRIRGNVQDMIVMERRIDAEEADKMYQAQREQQAAEAKPTQEEEDAKLCEGHEVTADLGDSGFMSLLERQLVGPGLQVMSSHLVGIAPHAGTAGGSETAEGGEDNDSIPGVACMVPRAICGDGRHGMLRLDVFQPLQLHGAVLCDPQSSKTDQLFVAATDLKPEDAELAGMRRVAASLQAKEIGPSTISRDSGVDTPGDFKADYLGIQASRRLMGTGEEVRLGLPLSAAGDPTGTRIMVQALDRFLTVTYNADKEFQRTKDAVHRLSSDELQD